MSNFNSRLVESLDVLNHILAGFFVAFSLFKFIDTVNDNFLVAVFDSLSVIGVGILTCGYIALMININNLLSEIRNKMS